MGKTNNIEFQEGDKIPIPEFSLDDMCKDPSIVMVAKRGSGKSWVTRAILYKLHKVPVGIIISPTEQDEPFYSDFFPDTYIFYAYNSKILTKLLFRQRLIRKKAREKKEEGKFIDPRAVLIMDDCLASKGAWAKDPPIHDVLFNGRHRKITYILTMQFPLGIRPELRSNFDYIILLADDQASNIKRVYDHYAGMFPTFDSFRQVFRQLTDDNGCMVIKCRGARGSLFDKIAFYKAPNLEGVPLDFGCKQFRKNHIKNYDKDWEEKKFAVDYDEMLINSKKTKSKIEVKKIRKDDL
jgi:hypothetical protein